MKAVTLISFILVIVGALNWLFIGLFGFNLVNALFGAIPLLENVIYIIVGICGIYLASLYKKVIY